MDGSVQSNDHQMEIEGFGAPWGQVYLENIPKVVVSVDGSVRVVCNVSKHLHSDDCIDEEQHHHQHHHIWKSLQKVKSNEK